MPTVPARTAPPSARRPRKPRRPPAGARQHADRRGLRGDRGALSLELAIVAPVVMLLLFAAVQVGLYVYAKDVAQTAAQQAVETARLRGATVADGERQAWDLLHRTGGSITSAGVSGSQGGGLVSVTVTGTVACWLPGVSFPVSETVTAAKEQVGP